MNFPFRPNPTGQRPAGESVAEEVTPSAESGVFSAKLGTPTWRKFVANKAFQDANRGAIAAENDYEARIARENAAAARPAPAAAASPAEKIEAKDGRLFRKVGTAAEELDPESLADDPVIGPHARRALFDRERQKTAREADEMDFRLRDPSVRVNQLSPKERQDAETELGVVGDVPEYAAQAEQIRQRLRKDDEVRKMEQSAYNARARARSLEAADPEQWWQSRTPQQGPTVQDARALQQSADVADESAAREMREIQQALQVDGVSGDKLDAAKARLAELADARKVIADTRREGDEQVAGVQERARTVASQGVVAARAEILSSLERLKVFPAFTAAMTVAKDKQLEKRDGKWVVPQMGRTADDDANPAMKMMAGLSGAAQSGMSRLGLQSDSMDLELKRVQKSLGLSDDEMKTAWRDLSTQYRKWEDGEVVRVQSNGDLVPNPTASEWLDSAKAARIIEQSGGSEASKQALTKNLAAMQAEIAAMKLEAYTAAGELQRPSRLAVGPSDLVKFKAPDDWAKENNRKDIGTPQFILDYERAEVNSKPWLIQKVGGLIVDTQQGNMKLASTLAGFAGALGSESAGALGAEVTDASGMAERGQYSTGLVGKVIEELPSLATQMGVGRAAAVLGKAITGSVKGARIAGVTASVSAAGAQSMGATFASEIAAGKSEEEARENAVMSGINTALITGIFQVGGLGGVESIAAGRSAASLTLADVMAATTKAELARNVRRFAGQVLKSAAGEAAEEGIDELTQAFITADPSSNLSDAWSNALEAAKVGGFIGGSVDVASKVAGGRTPTAPPAPTVAPVNDRVAAAVAAQAPDAPPPTQEEIRAAYSILPEDSGAMDVAEAVLIERELAEVKASEEAAMAAAEQAVTDAKASGDTVATAAAEAELEKLKTAGPAAPRVRAVLKIAGGQAVADLTDAEAASLGITPEGKPLPAAGLKAVGLTKPLIRGGVDGSPVLLDEALALVEKTSPLARSRVKLSEAEAFAKSKERAEAAQQEWEVGMADGTKARVRGADPDTAEQEAAVTGRIVPGSARKIGTAPPAAAPPAPTGTPPPASTPPAPKAGDDQDKRAAREGVLPPPPGKSEAERKAWVDAKIAERDAKKPAAKPGKASGIDLTIRNRKRFADDDNSIEAKVNRAINNYEDAGDRWNALKQSGATDEQILQEIERQFGHHGSSVHGGYMAKGTSLTEDDDGYAIQPRTIKGKELIAMVRKLTGIALPQNQGANSGSTSAPLAAARKRIEKIRKATGGKIPITESATRASTAEAGIKINPELIITQALDRGMTPAQAAQYFARVLDEEVRHFGHLLSARRLWEAAGSPGTLDAWRDAHYASIWQEDFVSTGKDKIIRDLYAADTTKAEDRAKFDSMPDWKKAMEGIRMMSQGGKVTEQAKLWADISQKLREALQAALDALKSLVADLDSFPSLKAEITNLENALREITRTPDSGNRPNKPPAVPKSDGDRPAAKRPGNQPPSGGRDQAGAGAGTGPVTVAVGTRVEFTRNGKRLTGVVDLMRGDLLRVRLDVPDSEGVPTRMALVGDVSVLASASVASPDSSVAKPTAGEDASVASTEVPRGEINPRDRNQFPGTDYPVPPNVIAFQPRGLDTEPLTDRVFTFPYDGTAEDAARVGSQAFTQMDGQFPEMSQRESVIIASGPDGMTKFRLRMDSVHNKVKVTTVDRKPKAERPKIEAPLETSTDDLVRATYAGAEARRKFDDLRPVMQRYLTDFHASGIGRTPVKVEEWLASKGVVGYVVTEVAEILKNLSLVDAIEAEKQAIVELNKRNSKAETPPAKPKAKPTRSKTDTPARRMAFEILSDPGRYKTITTIIGEIGRIARPNAGMRKIIQGLKKSGRITEKQRKIAEAWEGYDSYLPKNAFGNDFWGKVAQEVHGMLFVDGKSRVRLDDWATGLGDGTMKNDEAMRTVMAELTEISRGKPDDSRDPNREITSEEEVRLIAFSDANQEKPNVMGVRAGDMDPGDPMTIGGELFTVVANRDGIVMLEDGPKFGTQRVHEDDVLWLEISTESWVDDGLEIPDNYYDYPGDVLKAMANELLDFVDARGYESFDELAAEAGSELEGLAEPEGLAPDPEVAPPGDQPGGTPPQEPEGRPEGADLTENEQALGELLDDVDSGFSLETQTPEQIEAEKQAAERKEKIDKLKNKPLTGSAGDLTSDMFGEGDTPLFNDRRDTPAPKLTKNEEELGNLLDGLEAGDLPSRTTYPKFQLRPRKPTYYVRSNTGVLHPDGHTVKITGNPPDSVSDGRGADWSRIGDVKRRAFLLRAWAAAPDRRLANWLVKRLVKSPGANEKSGTKSFLEWTRVNLNNALLRDPELAAMDPSDIFEGLVDIFGFDAPVETSGSTPYLPLNEEGDVLFFDSWKTGFQFGRLPTPAEVAEAKEFAERNNREIFAGDLPESFSAGIPEDKQMAFLNVARKLTADGVDAPEKFAAALVKIGEKFNKDFRQYSDAVWSLFRATKPSLPQAGKWAEIYEGLNAPVEAKDAEINVGDWVRFKGRPDEGPWTVWSKDGSRVKLDNSTRNLSFNISGIEKVEAPQAESAAMGSQSMRLAEVIAERIRRKEKTSIQQLTDLAAGIFGSRTGENFDIKTAYDAVEMAINLLVMDSKIEVNVSAEKALENIAKIREWLEYIPTQTRRTGEMDQLQQFSTPPHFAYAAAWAAAIRTSDVGLEPSSGLGGLAAWMERGGASVQLNELSDRRREMLDALRIGPPATGHDAGLLHAILLPDINSGKIPQPTVVVMNPPFSNNAAGRKDLLTGAKHIDEALKLLPPGGRLVAIVGEGMAFDAPTYRPWWDSIRKKYSIRANIRVDGREYRKYGTTFSNRILIIDKSPPLGDVAVGGEVETIEELIPLLDQVRQTRPQSNESGVSSDSQASDQQSGNAPDEEGANDAGVIPGSSDSGAGTAGSDQGGAGGKRTGTRAGGGRGSRNGGNNRAPGPVTDTAANLGEPADGSSGVDSVGTPTIENSEVERDTQDPDADREIDGENVFANYQPTFFRLKGSVKHPTTLVESSVMATTQLPKSTVTLNLPQETVTSGALSDAQLEAIAYAAQAHETVFENGDRQGFFIGDGTGVGKGREIAGTILHNFREGRRKAVWISEKEGLSKDARRDLDGIGGKEIAVHEMVKKITPPPGDGVAFLTYDGLKNGFNGIDSEGKIRTNGNKASRIKTLLDWLGADFDGVIALDEVHNAGNVIPIKGTRGYTQPSKKALAVVDLQNVFPKARILYVSATGATEPNNLAFASRLGLWGVGKAFDSAVKFYTEIKSAGLSAMEIVARDLKAMGLYMARTLSFQGIDGGDPVGFDRLEHQLTADQEEIYRKAAEGWQTIFANLDLALDATGAGRSATARSAASSAFWGSQQRFFNGLLTAMQMPSALRDMRKRLDEGGSIVIQLINTNEAALDRAIDRALQENPENPDYESVDLSSRQDILDYIFNSFPVQQFHEVSDGEYADGTPKTTWVPLNVTDADGNVTPVLNPEAVAARDQLLEEIATLALPDPPLEQLFNAFGEEAVAEITGRSRRLIRRTDDQGVTRRVLETGRGKPKVQKDKNDFLDGKRRILVFSDAGGTGFSYHAGANFKNQQKRFQYVVQAGWRADKAIQGLGRTHRADQVKTPHFILVSTNVSGHKRFISTIARRLQQLGALTSGERKTTGQGLFNDDDNLEDSYAELAVRRFFNDLFRGAVAGMNFQDVSNRLGYVKTVRGEPVNTLVSEDGSLNSEKIPPLKQFLNRILAMPIAEQNATFDAFITRRAAFVEQARESGSYDSGVETFVADDLKINRDETVFEDPNSSASTRLVEVGYKRYFDYNTFDFVASFASNPKWVVSRDGKRIYALGDTDLTITQEDGRVLPAYRRYGLKSATTEAKEKYVTGKRPGFAKVGDEFTDGIQKWRLESIEAGDNPQAKIARVPNDGMTLPESMSGTVNARASHLEALFRQTGNMVEGVNENARYLPEYYELTPAEAKEEWNRLLAGEPKFEERSSTFIVGSTLPVWHRIPFYFKQVKRVTTEDGKSFLGVIVPDDKIDQTRNQLGAAAAGITPSRVIDAIINRKAQVELSNGWVMKFTKSAGEDRIELVGPDQDWSTGVYPRWQAYGFIERINFRPRFFIAAEIKAIDRLLRYAPGMRIIEAQGGLQAGDLPPAQRTRITRLQKVIDAKYASGRTDGIEDLEAKLEALLENADTDLMAGEMDPDADEAAMPSNETALIEWWMRWTGADLAGRNNSPQEDFDSFGAYVRDAARGEGPYVISEGVTDAQIEEAAKDAFNAYTRRRNAMKLRTDSPEWKAMSKDERRAYLESRKGLQAGDLPAPFYSALQRAVQAKIPARATPEQILQSFGEYIVTETKEKATKVVGRFPIYRKAEADSLAATVSEGRSDWNSPAKVKAEEIKWSGIEQALPSLAVDGKVSKDALLKYLREEGSVRLEEVTLEDNAASRSDRWEVRPKGEGFAVWDEFTGEWESNITSEEAALTRMYGLQRSDRGRQNNTKYSKYVLPGGENQREVVLAMPNTKLTKKQFLEANGITEDRWNAMDATEKFYWDGRHYTEHTTAGYTSTHFPDVPNYVAHMRTNERDGGLFIEEIQSDRHQAGRKKGYTRLEDNKSWRAVAKSGAMGPAMDSEAEAQAWINSRIAEKDRALWEVDFAAKTIEGIAPAPFQTTWPLAMFKRALRDAVASGKEWIGWTDGKTQNERFKLSTRIEAIRARKDGDKWTLEVKPKNADVSAVIVAEDALPENVGKDFAQKIIDDGGGTYTGLDLDVGGDGMKGFYDNMLPKEIGKYVKQWGGRVEKGKIEEATDTKIRQRADDQWAVVSLAGEQISVHETENEAIESAKIYYSIWRVDITPQMKESILQGQALFAGDLPSPADETAANIEALRIDANKRVPRPFVEELRAQQSEFGRGAVGVPRLANPGDTARSRDEQSIAQLIYEHNRERREDRSVIAEARRRLAEDPAGVEEKILQAAFGGMFATDDADHVAARLLINQRAKEAGNDLAKHEANMGLRMAYQLMRAETARQLRIGHDLYQTPAERHREMIADAIYTPSLKVQKKARESNWSPERRREFIRQESAKRIKRINDAMKKMGVTMDEILSGEAYLSLSQDTILKNALRQRSAEEQLVIKLHQRNYSMARIKKNTGLSDSRIQEIVEKMYDEMLEKAREKVRAGMTLENYQDRPRGLQAGNLPGDLTPEQEAEARRIVEIGFGLRREVPTVTTRTRRAPAPEESENARIQRVATRLIGKFAESQSDTLRWRPKSERSTNDLVALVNRHIKVGVENFREQAVAIGATEDQARILDLEIGEERRRVAAIKEAKKQDKVTNPLTANWTRPIFTDGLNSYSFDSKDRAELMARVAAIRGIAGATGKIKDLSGKKREEALKLLEELNAVLARYGTDAEGIFRSGKPAEDYRFDINDRYHVAAVARAISAIDADIVDKTVEMIYSNILSGLKTMIVNATGGVAGLYETAVSRQFEAAINALFNDPMAASFAESKYILKAVGPIWARSWTNAVATWGSELPMFDEDFLGQPADLGKLFDGTAPRIGSIGGRKGRLIRIPTRLLLATDEFNRTALASLEVGAMAYRTGLELGLKPGTREFDRHLRIEVNTPGSFSSKLAAQKASRMIFTNPLPGQRDPVTGKIVPTEGIGDAIGEIAGKLNELLTKDRDNLFTKAAFAAARVLFIPFQRTPFNILRKGARFTLNPISLIDIGLLFAQNNLTLDEGKLRWTWNSEGRNAELIERTAQQLQGGLLMLLIAAFARGEGDEDDLDKLFVITGSQPYNPRKRGLMDARARAGVGPYRISFRSKDGNERWGFNYGRIEPLGTTLGMTVDSIRMMKRGWDGSNPILSVIGGMVAQTQEKTYLSGLSDMFRLGIDMVADEDFQSNKQLARFAAGRMAMLLPNFIRQPVRETDPYFRERADSFTQEFMYQMWPHGQKAPKRDLYGEAIEKTGTMLSRPVDIFSIGNNPVNPVDEMLLRFAAANPDKAWFPQPLTSSTYRDRRTGETVKMTAEQLDRFKEMTGQRFKALTQRAVLNTKNPTLRDIEVIKALTTKARADAKKIIEIKPN